MQAKCYCSDELWGQFADKATKIHPDKSISDVLRSLIENYVKGTKEEPLDLIMGVEEAAKLWGFHPSTVKNFCAAGKVPARKFGKTWIIDKRAQRPGKGDSQDAISENRKESTSTR